MCCEPCLLISRREGDGEELRPMAEDGLRLATSQIEVVCPF
jgi:hypothetical protein